MKTSLSNVLLGVAQCILLLTCGVQSAAAQSLVNGSFELPALPGGYQYSPAAAGIGWAFSGSSGIQGNGSAWTAAPAPDGTQTAFIQGTGSMSQALLLSAGTYTLSFQAAWRSCCVAPYLQPLMISIDGAQIGGLVSPASTSFGNFNVTFPVATTGVHSVAFIGTDATDKTTFVDKVTLILNNAAGDVVWVDDSVPAGAVLASDGADVWNWVSANPQPFSGALAHQSTLAAAEHQHYFYAASATLQVEAGESLFAYVYLDPVNPPSELILQWSDASWEHRAYWGANLIPWGIDGGAARRYMGALPLSGQWVRLQVPAAQVGLEGSSLNGMAYTLYGGRASWDYAGKTVAGALLPQTISFGALGNQTLGSGALTLSATASSGLPVSFSSLTAPVCTLSANTVTLIAAGTCSIRASQAGNGTYAPAPNVDQSFVITSGQLFAPAISYATGSYPLAVAVADFNGDGKLDVAVINDSSSTVSIFLGGGDGTLHLSATLSTGIFGSHIVTGDFNNDGKTDLAVSNIGSNTIGIYLGNGDGTFRLPIAISAGLAPGSLAVADLNGDGKQDLVVSNISSGNIVGHSITVLMGNGDGSFAAPVAYSTGTNPQDVAIADFNGDGKPDLIVANYDDSTLSVLFGNGDGTFAPRVDFATGFRPSLVGIADLNGDGKLDLAVVNSFGVSIHLGHGDGSFSAASNIVPSFSPDGMAIGDFTGDGIPDLASGNVFASNVGLFAGNGTGSFQVPTMFNVASGPIALAAASLRNNGALDLIVANRMSNVLSVLLNTLVAMPPATLSVRSGTAQSATIGTYYVTPLAVMVLDANGRALPGLVVTFTAPAIGASGSFAGGQAVARAITDAFGIAAAPAFTANSSGGSFAVVASVGALNATFSMTNLATDVAPTISSSPPAGGRFGTPYSYTVRAIAIPPASYAVISGTLPAGLTMNAATGTISGTPSAAGTFTGVISASNGVNPPATQSFSIMIAQATQSITFGALSSRALGAPPFAVGATASSGLPVMFSSLTSAVCTVSGNTVTLVAAGTCGIRASQTGDANYQPAANVDQSFTVISSLLSQTISFGPLANRSLSTPPFTLSATATSGLTVSFSSMTPAVCTMSGNRVTLVAAGICTVRAAQAGNNSYAPAPNVDQSFNVIVLIAQTITFAGPPFLPYGAVLALAATASSGLAVSFSSLTPAVCAVSGTTATMIAIGSCTIRASQAGDASYAPAPNVDRSFGVISAAQTINFLPISSIGLGAAPSELQASASSGLPVSFASLTPAVCRVNDNWFVPLIVGTCTVRASQGGNANYSAAVNVDRSFTISPESQTLLFPQPVTQSLRSPQFHPSATASSGLPVTFSSLTPSVCSASDSVVTLVAAGSCTIRATQAGSASYQAVSADRSFIVQSASVGVGAAGMPLPGPFIEYSTRLGGYGQTFTGADKAFDVVVGADGSAWVAGSVAGTYFPGLSSAAFTNGGLDLLYVAKINPNRGQLDFATIVGARSAGMTDTGALVYVGGTATDVAEAIAADSSGNVYVAAHVNSTTYPLSGGVYTRAGPKAIFRVGSDGSVQATAAVVDPAVQSIRALALDSAGAVYFTGVAGAGLATSVNAAIPAASAPAGGPYLIKFSPGGGSVAYATYLSAAGSRPSIAGDSQQSAIDTQTTAYALAIDSAGNAYLAGQAKAGDFPVTPGAPDTTDNQNRDAFVAKVNATGSALLWVARLGGSDAERATGIALAPDGSVVIGGKTATWPFPGTPGAFQSYVQFVLGEGGLFASDRETGFVAKLAADGSRWIFVAPIGAGVGNLVRNANGDPTPVKVAVDPSGAIYAAGRADHRLPVGAMNDLGDLQPIQSPAYYDDGTAALLYGPDASFRNVGGFLMKISADGQRLLYSIIVNSGTITGMTLDAFGAAYVAGYNAGSPQVNAAQAAPGAVFVAKLIGQSMPIVLSATPNPAAAGQSVTLTASAGDPRYSGSIEFRDGGQLLQTAPLISGTATWSTVLPVGIHRLSAVFRGNGPFSSMAAPEIVHVVNQASP